MASVIR